jgi:hypothetical protein
MSSFRDAEIELSRVAAPLASEAVREIEDLLLGIFESSSTAITILARRFRANIARR